jgi:hypothetical protein
MTTPNSPRPRRKAVPESSWSLPTFSSLLLVCGLLALGFVGFHVYSWATKDRLLDASATPAHAKVLRAYRSSRFLNVEYEFAVRSSENADPERFKRTQTVSESTYEKLKNGGTVLIEYYPDNPRVSRVADDLQDLHMHFAGGIYSFLMSVPCLVGSLWLLLTHRVAKELDTKGRVVGAKVTDVWSVVKRDGKGGCWQFHYVAYAFGEGHAAYQRIGADRAQGLHIGDELLIRYLERDPRRSRIEPPEA